MKNNISFPSPSDLAAFQVIASTGSLSRAAERLGVGQPGLSLVVKRLESAMEVPLFFRRNRGLTLTAAGDRLLRQCNVLEEHWTRLLSETRNSADELTGIFKIGCHTAVAHYALSPFVRNVHSELPGIQLELTHGLSREIGAALISGHIDFGFVINPVRHPDLIIRKLADDEVCFWGAPNHIRDVLICDPSLSQSQYLLKTGAKRFKRMVHSPSLEVIASLAKAGAGAAILPERVARILAPSLKRLPHTHFFKDEITFVYRQDMPKTAASSALVALARNLEL